MKSSLPGSTRKNRTRSNGSANGGPPSSAHFTPVRFAVVGLGFIAQSAVLPAFEHTKNQCRVTALISGDPEKLDKLSNKYGVENVFSYEEYDRALRSGTFDAVYIALPNTMHADYSIRAAHAGIHVLCEKPMAMTEDECRRMIEASRENSVKLMIAYRLHFEEANLSAVEVLRSGTIGDPRLFSAAFSMQVREGDIRTSSELGGGALYDLGIYCINAARYLFQSEPERVTALVSNPDDPRFDHVDAITGGLLDFGNGRLATFACSHAAADSSRYDVVGTGGSLRVEPAFDYETPLVRTITRNGHHTKKTFPKRDQFAALLMRFAQAISDDLEIEASGREGLADVRIMRGLLRSSETGMSVELEDFEKHLRPNLSQELRRPALKRAPRLVHAVRPMR